MVNVNAAFDRGAVTAEYEQAGDEFHRLLTTLTREQLGLPSNGTRWTNEQLLFHMLFGYMVVRQLIWLVRTVDRLPAPIARGLARLLNAGTKPFDLVNYWGSHWGARVINRNRMGRTWDRVTAGLLRRLERESEGDLKRSMPYPTRWDPFFSERMTLGDVYHYPSLHFWFHHRQLSRLNQTP
jgi:hypothetical protein